MEEYIVRLNWVNNGFICKELYAPFVVENDNDYYDDLLSKFNLVLRQAKSAGADEDSIKKFS